MINKRGIELFSLIIVSILFLSVIVYAQTTGSTTQPTSDKSTWDSIKSNGVVEYLFGTNGQKNILQRGIGFFGYGNETTATSLDIIIGLIFGGLIGLVVFKRKILATILGVLIGGFAGYYIGGFVGILPIIVAGIICFALTKTLEYFLTPIAEFSKTIEDIMKWFVFKMNLLRFVGLYTLVFGLIFVLLNVPGISLLKPLFWPLFTDFGVGLLPLSQLATKFGAGIGVYIVRGIVFGIFSFLILLLLMFIVKAHKIITDLTIYYQNEKARIKAQKGARDILFGTQILQNVGSNAQKGK